MIASPVYAFCPHENRCLELLNALGRRDEASVEVEALRAELAELAAAAALAINALYESARRERA